MAVQSVTKPTEQAKKGNRWYPPPQGEWTYHDYAQLPDNGMRYEVIEGDLYMSPVPRPKHQMILAELYTHFRDHVSSNDLGQVLFAPIDVIMGELTTPIQPDLLYIAKEHLNMITETRVEGVPDLIVEVLSPGNAALDRDKKFRVYAQAGVKEYWVVDGDGQTIDVFVLRGQAYAPLGHFTAEETTLSEVLSDFSVTVSDICP